MAAVVKEMPACAPVQENKNYRGFVAGVFSGIAKLSGECPDQAEKSAHPLPHPAPQPLSNSY